jgi:hypothetical protein
MLAMRPLNVEIGLINVVANKQIISSDFMDIKKYMVATDNTPPVTDANVKSVIDGANNYPSFVTKTRNATQRDASKLFE